MQRGDSTTEQHHIVFTRHALDQAGVCGADTATLRQSIAELAPTLRPSFVGLLGGAGKVALMHRAGPSPVVRLTPLRTEVITVLRPGQRVIRRDTIELWVG